MTKRLISMMAAVLVVLALTPFTFAATISSSGSTVKGGDTINADGTYYVEALATGTITIAAGKKVTLTGSGTGSGAAANQELSIQCGKGVQLTVKDLWIANEKTENNLIDFTGTGNVLKAEGVNVLESKAYLPCALIHVGPDTELSFEDGGGTAYLYKYTAGSGIGSNAEEANGTINFAGGRWFIKGSKTGAVIGNDTCGDAAKEKQIKPVNISGGELYIEANAMGAAIGGSRMSVGGDVNLSGGAVAIWVDFSASAIGSGAVALGEGRSNGQLTVTGGSLKIFVNQNAVYDWNLKEAQICDNPVTVTKMNGAGKAVVRYLLDVSGYQANASGAPYNVSVDGASYYSGPLHNYTYSANTESTMANWVQGNDKNLYLYLTEGSHQISVNGSTAQTVQVTAPVYESGKITVPEESWAQHTELLWYNETDQTFTIHNSQELAGLAAIVREGVDTFENKTIMLDEDFSLQAYAWEPIGTADHPFKGIFAGENHTITWPLIDQTSKSEQGLFGVIQGGTVQDLTVSKGSISGYYNVGAVAGYAEDTAFKNCSSNVTLFAQYTGGTGGGQYGDFVGGILGLGRRCTVTDCENQGYVSGNRRVGGIAGGLSGTLKNCTNYGKCLTRNENCAGIVAVGSDINNIVNGIYHLILDLTIREPLEIEECVNNGEISGLSASGIISYMNAKSSITNCINNGNVDCGRTGGGIAGSISSTEFYTTVINNCVNNGSLCSSQGDGSGVGGIVGESRGGSILSCRNNGSVTGGKNCNSDSYGGIAGRSTVSTCMENCYNSASVSSYRDTDYVGALVGRIGTLAKDVAEGNFVSVLTESMTGYKENYFVSGAAAGGLGGVVRRTDSDQECFTLNCDIEGRLSVDPETVVEPAVMAGDLNGDNKVNGKDATKLAKYLVGSVQLTAEELAAADVNHDGKVNGKDATRLAKYLVGSITNLNS